MSKRRPYRSRMLLLRFFWPQVFPVQWEQTMYLVLFRASFKLVVTAGRALSGSNEQCRVATRLASARVEAYSAPR